MDRRKRKTQAALKQSLVSLLLEKPIEKISIRELAERADVNRSTFYANYQDIYELLEALELELYENLEVRLLAAEEQSMADFVRLTLDYMAEEQQLMRLVFLSPSGRSFSKALGNLLRRHYEDYYREALGRSLSQDEHYLVGYHVAGLQEVLTKGVAESSLLDRDLVGQLILKTDQQLDRLILGK